MDARMFDPDRHLPLIGARARKLRPTQVGPEWEALRDKVSRTLAHLICEHGSELRMVEVCAGTDGAICAALTDREAVISVDEGVSLISSVTGWTSMREEGQWDTPQRAVITFLYSTRPSRKEVH
jgi:hypothetical protein